MHPLPIHRLRRLHLQLGDALGSIAREEELQSYPMSAQFARRRSIDCAKQQASKQCDGLHGASWCCIVHSTTPTLLQQRLPLLLYLRLPLLPLLLATSPPLLARAGFSRG